MLWRAKFFPRRLLVGRLHKFNPKVTQNTRELCSVMADGRKRVRRGKGVCPNPLFVKWVEEWLAEAREKEQKSQYAYSKASFCFNPFNSVINARALTMNNNY